MTDKLAELFEEHAAQDMARDLAGVQRRPARKLHS
jgi:hypothetical protein